jgi:hypothetical protein
MDLIQKQPESMEMGLVPYNQTHGYGLVPYSYPVTTPQYPTRPVITFENLVFTGGIALLLLLIGMALLLVVVHMWVKRQLAEVRDIAKTTARHESNRVVRAAAAQHRRALLAE